MQDVEATTPFHDTLVTMLHVFAGLEKAIRIAFGSLCSTGEIVKEAFAKLEVKTNRAHAIHSASAIAPGMRMKPYYFVSKKD